MALYTPDYKYIRGKQFLENLKGIEGEEIRYYLQKKEEHYAKVETRLNKLLDAISIITNFAKY